MSFTKEKRILKFLHHDSLHILTRSRFWFHNKHLLYHFYSAALLLKEKTHKYSLWYIPLVVSLHTLWSFLPLFSHLTTFFRIYNFSRSCSIPNANNSRIRVLNVTFIALLAASALQVLFSRLLLLGKWHANVWNAKECMQSLNVSSYNIHTHSFLCCASSFFMIIWAGVQ